MTPGSRSEHDPIPPTEGSGETPDPSAYLPLPHLALHVLLALAESDRHGWAIIKTIHEMTDGKTDPSTGSLYLSMTRLEEKGLIGESPERPDPNEDDARRRYYRLTPLGRRVLAAETRRLAHLVDVARGWNVLDGAGREGA